MRTRIRLLVVMLIATFSLTACQAQKAETSPAKLKVFILAGQSNMVGDGRIDPVETKGTLAYMAFKSEKKEQFKDLIDANGEWVTRSDVWYFQRQFAKGPDSAVTDVASGLKPGLQGDKKKRTVGPELQFGHAMGDHFVEPLLIIKTAWGGKSLAVDFRPPSAGKPEFEIKANKEGVKREAGKFYRLMLADIKYILDDIAKYFPYYKGQGYEIVGFGWHQGWNDGTNKVYAEEYEKNLPLLIKDVRRDLGVPNLPVVIASSGFGGNDEALPGVRGTIKNVVEPAQVAVGAKMDNVTTVKARGFYRPRDESPTGAVYHWNSNAETYFLIGDAMAKAMLELIGK